MILTLFNQKGGVGKTTLAVFLADALSQELETVLIDLDNQGTLSRLAHLDTFELPVRTVANVEEINQQPEALKIVDCPPYIHGQAEKLFQLSDLVLMPTKTGYGDFFSLSDGVDIAKDVGAQAAIVFNLVKPGSAFGDELWEYYESFGVPILQSQIRDRVAYGRALAYNSLEGFDTKATTEMETLVNEIKYYLYGQKERPY